MTCLVIVVTILIKRGKRIQNEVTITDGNHSAELNSYDKPKTKAMDLDTYYDSCKEIELGEQPYETMTNEPIYECLEIGTTNTLTEIRIPELPPRQDHTEYAEPFAMPGRSENDYMPMDVTNIIDSDYDDIKKTK